VIALYGLSQGLITDLMAGLFGVLLTLLILDFLMFYQSITIDGDQLKIRWGLIKKTYEISELSVITVGEQRDMRIPQDRYVISFMFENKHAMLRYHWIETSMIPRLMDELKLLNPETIVVDDVLDLESYQIS